MGPTNKRGGGGMSYKLAYNLIPNAHGQGGMRNEMVGSFYQVLCLCSISVSFSLIESIVSTI